MNGNDGPTGPETPAEGIDETYSISRRRFLGTAAAAGVAVATGAGGAAADHSGLNYQSGLVPDPWIAGPVTIGEHDREEMDAVTEFIDDSDELADLADYGAVVEPREDEETVHNPITLRADRILADDFHKFPRGETWDHDSDSDTDEEDLDVLDATHWTADESGGGSLSVSDVDAPSDGPALKLTASSNDGSSDVVTATFTDVEISSGELRKYLQAGVTVDALPSGSLVTIRVTDSNGKNVDVTIDPSGDASNDDVIATATTTGAIYQQQLGDLTDSLDTISEVQVRLEGNVDMTLFAFNLERSDRWGFGTEEYKNDDDEVDTRTIYEPTGTFDITSIDSLDDVFSNASLADVTSDLRFETSGASDQGENLVEYEFEDIDHATYPRRFSMVVNRELPTAYDLEYGSLVLESESVVYSDQYETIEVDTGLDEAIALEDVDDDLDGADKTSTAPDPGEEYELSSTVSAGDVATVFYEVRVQSSGESDMTAAGGIGGPAGSGGGGFFSSAQGMLAGVLAGVGAFVAMFRSRIFG